MERCRTTVGSVEEGEEYAYEARGGGRHDGLLALSAAACGKEGEPTPSAGGNASGGAQSDTCKSSGATFTPKTDAAVAGSPTFEKIKAAGKVSIGVKFDQPNLGYKDAQGKRCGFDIEIAQYVASTLGIDPAKIEYKEIASANRETAIKGGEVDYYVGTYSITDKRKNDISFAGPYFVAGQDLLVRKDETSITGKDTLKGKKVCSATGSTPIQRIRDEGLTEANNIVEFKTYWSASRSCSTRRSTPSPPTTPSSRAMRRRTRTS